jgi:hypothetical protein
MKIKFRIAYATQNEKKFVAFGYRTLEELLNGCFEDEKMNEEIAPFDDLEDAVELDIISKELYYGLDSKGEETYLGDFVQLYRHCDIEHKHIKQTRSKYKRNGNTATYIGEENDIRQVCHEYGALYLYGDDGGHGVKTNFCDLSRPGQSFIKIGNIHENKELLNESI